MKNKIPLNTYKVIWQCECGGTMEREGGALMSNPPKYPHRCIECGRLESAEKMYPCIEHEEE